MVIFMGIAKNYWSESACAGYLGHPLGKEAHDAVMPTPLSTRVVCGEQETGRSSRETEPEEPTERQSSRVRRWGASQRGEQSSQSIIYVIV